MTKREQTKALARFLDGHAPYIAAAEQNQRWRKARSLAMEELRGIGPALGLSLIDMAEVAEGYSQELRQKHQAMKLIADKGRR